MFAVQRLVQIADEVEATPELVRDSAMEALRPRFTKLESNADIFPGLPLD